MTSHTIITNPRLDLICASVTRLFGFSSPSVSRVTTSHDHLLISHPKLLVPFPSQTLSPTAIPRLLSSHGTHTYNLSTLLSSISEFSFPVVVYCPVSSSPLPTHVLHHRCWSSPSHLPHLLVTWSNGRSIVDVRHACALRELVGIGYPYGFRSKVRA